MRWSWLSWHSPDEPELDHPPREKEGKYSMGGNLSEGGSVWGNWFISTQQLGWEKRMLWLTAPVLQGWRAVAALGRPVLDPHLILPRTQRGKANGLKGKWPAEKIKQPQLSKDPSQHCFSLRSQRDRSRGLWAQGDFTPHPNPHMEPGSNPQLDYLHQETPPQWHQPTVGSVLGTALAHPIWVERCWGDAASTA